MYNVWGVIECMINDIANAYMQPVTLSYASTSGIKMATMDTK